MNHSLRSLMVAMVSLGLIGCIMSPDTPDDEVPLDPEDVQRDCPSDQPHLAVALRQLSSDESSQLARLDHRLQLCRGVVFDHQEGSIQAVGGTASGRELVGFDSGRVYLVDDTTLVWGVESVTVSAQVGALFSMSFQGRQVAAVLWMDHNNYAQALDLLELADGTPIQGFGVDSSVVDAAPAIDGSDARIAGLVNWEGIQHYRAEAGADSLGTIGELQVAAPRSGEFAGLSTARDPTLIAAAEGVLYWPADRSLAFLGPIRCAWPAFQGEAVPDGEEEYLAVAPVIDSDTWFLAAANAALDSDERNSYLFQMNRAGECFAVASATASHRIVDLAWSGR